MKKYIGILIFLLGCQTLSSSRGTLRASYAYPSLNSSWKPMKVSGVDAAFMNKDGSTFLINSTCREDVDTSLKGLTVQLLIGFTHEKILSQTTRMLQEREALETLVSARLDGVSRQLKILVLKKDDCIYDITLSAHPSVFETHEKTYEELVLGLQIGSGT